MKVDLEKVYLLASFIKFHFSIQRIPISIYLFFAGCSFCWKGRTLVVRNVHSFTAEKRGKVELEPFFSYDIFLKHFQKHFFYISSSDFSFSASLFTKEKIGWITRSNHICFTFLFEYFFQIQGIYIFFYLLRCLLLFRRFRNEKKKMTWKYFGKNFSTPIKCKYYIFILTHNENSQKIWFKKLIFIFLVPLFSATYRRRKFVKLFACLGKYERSSKATRISAEKLRREKCNEFFRENERWNSIFLAPMSQKSFK